jgi:hypothetical protein
MKRFSQRTWHEPPTFKIVGVTESGKVWIAFLLVALVLMTLVVAFIYSSSPTRVPFPPY